MRSNDRVFLLLEQLADNPPQTLAEVADRTGLPRPTVLRFLREFESRALATRDAQGRYSLGPAVIALAHRYLSATPLLAAAAAPMHALRDELGETISLSALAGDRRVYVLEIPSLEPLRHVHGVGSVGPLHAGASGRLLLAFLPDADRARLLAGELPRYTQTTLVDRAELERDCAAIRKRGWTISHGEKTKGSVALAVPVADPGTGAVYALAAFAPEVRFDADRDLETWVTHLHRSAHQIEEESGAPEPQASTRG